MKQIPGYASKVRGIKAFGELKVTTNDRKNTVERLSNQFEMSFTD